MPYTPPSQQSPAASKLSSPPFSRNQSLAHLDSSPPRSPGPRPNLPRSNSASTDYLTRSRRSPSLQQNGSVPASKADYSRSIAESLQRQGLSINTAMRQSPPPASDNVVPAGMIVSPPDSTQNSSDDDEPVTKSDRHVENLAELQDAVRRSLSPQTVQAPPVDGSSGDTSQESQKDTPQEQLPQGVNDPPRLTPQARKISHSRSTTESSFFLNSLNDASQSDGSDEDGDSSDRPPLLRKKSGELVKPAIRPQSRRKHSSMPGTPTFSKAVHFNDDIEQVKHFLQVDRPIAVSAGASPVDGMEDESEFPFGNHASQGHDLEITLTNFPRDSLERVSQPVHVEKIYLAQDQKSLLGTVAVANLSFHKLVVARFTFDYWQTTSEVVAEYNNDLRLQPRTDGYDQFNFNIKLSDHKDLDSKTFLLCVRYNVNGLEYWDNNASMNYQVEFKTTPKKNQQPAKSAPNGVGTRAIPRSRHNSAASHGRPRSMPSFDDFFGGSHEANPFDLRRNASKQVLPDAPVPKKNSSGQPFTNRYDFGASLTAALNQAQASLGDRSGLQQTPDTSRTVTPAEMTNSHPAPFVRSGFVAPSNSGNESPRPDALLANRQSVDSKAYQDFVNKFCFFGTGKPTANQAPSPQPPTSGDDHQDLNSFNGSSERSENAFTHAPQTDYQFPTTTATSKGLSPSQSGYSSPTMSTGRDIRSSSPVHGYPYQQSPGMFTPDSQTQPVLG